MNWDEKNEKLKLEAAKVARKRDTRTLREGKAPRDVSVTLAFPIEALAELLMCRGQEMRRAGRKKAVVTQLNAGQRFCTLKCRGD